MEQNLAGLTFSAWAPRTKKYQVWVQEGAFWALASLPSALSSSCLWVTSDGSLMFQQEGGEAGRGGVCLRKAFQEAPGLHLIVWESAACRLWSLGSGAASVRDKIRLREEVVRATVGRGFGAARFCTQRRSQRLEFWTSLDSPHPQTGEWGVDAGSDALGLTGEWGGLWPSGPVSLLL